MSGFQVGPGNDGAMAIFKFKKCNALAQSIADKFAAPDILFPFPITIVKIPSGVEVT